MLRLLKFSQSAFPTFQGYDWEKNVKITQLLFQMCPAQVKLEDNKMEHIFENKQSTGECILIFCSSGGKKRFMCRYKSNKFSTFQIWLQ